jgi:hypothetical protein
MRPYLEITHHKKKPMEWFKVEALSSNHSTTHTQKKGLGFLEKDWCSKGR